MKQYVFIIWVIMCMSVNACGSRTSQQKEVELALVGQWISDTERDVYEFLADGRYIWTQDDGQYITGQYRSATPERYLDVELEGTTINLRISCTSDNQLIFNQSSDYMYSQAIWYRVDFVDKDVCFRLLKGKS